MLLIGIGGSGRQSLSRLSAYIIGFKVFQIEVTKHYRKNEFREGMSERILYAGFRSSRFEVLVTAASVIVCSHKFNERRHCFFFFHSQLEAFNKKQLLFYPSLPQRALCASMAPWPSLSLATTDIFLSWLLTGLSTCFPPVTISCLSFFRFSMLLRKTSTVITDSVAIKEDSS